jgi:hypothetical protein
VRGIGAFRKFHVEPRDARGRDRLDFDGRADITS